VQRTRYCVNPSKELNMKANVYAEGRSPAVPLRHESGQPPSQKTRARARAGAAKWLVAALLILSAIPLGAGAVRLSELAGGAAITPANARFFAAPLPVVLHIGGAAVYAILGAFQFAPLSGGAGPAGTAWPGGCWWPAACWWGCRGCG
jgi:hypothetical protein